jgi:hypothetical protein
MISNKSNRRLINEVLEDFAQSGIDQLKESLESAVIKYHTIVVSDRFDDLHRYLKNRRSMQTL